MKNQNSINKILSFLSFSERLKIEMRHSWLSNGRRESVAEHTWQMALMAILLHHYLKDPINISKMLKMILIHDLVEGEVGDIPFFEESERSNCKVDRENQAIKNIRASLPNKIGQEIFDLWHEFEDRTSSEAKFAKALDNLEVQIQHNLASFDTWLPVEYELVYTKMDESCSHDEFLIEFCDAVKMAAEEKMRNSGVDIPLLKDSLKGRVFQK